MKTAETNKKVGQQFFPKLRVQPVVGRCKLYHDFILSVNKGKKISYLPANKACMENCDRESM